MTKPPEDSTRNNGAGTPGDSGFTAAIQADPIDSSRTTDEIQLRNHLGAQHEIGKLSEKVNRLEADYGALKTSIDDLSSKLWKHVLTLVGAGATGLFIFWAIQKDDVMQVKESIDPQLMENAEDLAANKTAIENLTEKIEFVRDSTEQMSIDLSDLKTELAIIKDRTNP